MARLLHTKHGIYFIVKIAYFIGYSILACPAIAQVWSLPPSSTQDGVLIQPIGANSGSDSWSGLNSLGAYSTSGDGYSSLVSPNVPDSMLGLVWTHTAPSSMLASLDSVLVQGGTVRTIFLGETAGLVNNFGYTYSGVPYGAGAYTLFKDIEAGGNSPSVNFGDYADIQFTAGASTGFDFWLNAVVSNRVYSLFNRNGNDSPVIADQILWSVQALSVKTWVPSLGTYANLDTYLISIEDSLLANGADRDYSDLRLALQFLDASGQNMAPIPEPAHFASGVVLLVLGGTIFLRRRIV